MAVRSKYRSLKPPDKRFSNMHVYNNVAEFNFFFFKKGGNSSQTRRAYEGDFKSFSRYFSTFLKQGEMTPKMTGYHLLSKGHQFAVNCLQNYKSNLEKTDLASSTINRRLACVKSYVSEANSYGLIDWTISLKPVKQRKKRKVKGPNTDQIKELWAYLEKKEYFEGARDRLIFSLFFHLGLRRFEIAGLLRESYLPKSKAIKIKEKGYRDEAQLDVPQKTQKAFEEYIPYIDKRRKKLFFLDQKCKKELQEHHLYTILGKWQKDLGNKFEIRPHGLRHSSITAAMIQAEKHGINLEEILQFSRHKCITTLLKYRDQHRNTQSILANLISDI